MTSKPVDPRGSIIGGFAATLALCAGAGALLALTLFGASALIGSQEPPAAQAPAAKTGPAAKVGPMLTERANLPPAPKPQAAPPRTAHAAPPEPQAVRVQSGATGRVQTYYVTRLPSDPAESEPDALAAPEPEAPPLALAEPEATMAAAPASQGRPSAARCTAFKTYNPASQTYRGYDGKIRDCKPAGGEAAAVTAGPRVP